MFHKKESPSAYLYLLQSHHTLIVEPLLQDWVMMDAQTHGNRSLEEEAQALAREGRAVHVREALKLKRKFTEPTPEQDREDVLLLAQAYRNKAATERKAGFLHEAEEAERMASKLKRSTEQGTVFSRFRKRFSREHR